MKIVQSLWVKPSIKKNSVNTSDRNTGGWTDKKYNYISWALSCLQFCKYYNKVELITDNLGYDTLIKKMKLPYTDVKVVLDDLNDYHPDLWALGKIYAYSLQKEPFIHADGDVFIYAPFSKELESSALLAQNIEKDFYYYREIFGSIEENFDFIPGALTGSRDRNQQISAINAGIIGGTNIDFFSEYTEMAFQFVNKNLLKAEKINIGMFNTVFEQFLFYAMAEEKNITINCYFPEDAVNHAFDGLAEISSLPDKVKYVHTVGSYKKKQLTGEMLAFRLQSDYPDYYYEIMNLLRTNQI